MNLKRDEGSWMIQLDLSRSRTRDEGACGEASKRWKGNDVWSVGRLSVSRLLGLRGEEVMGEEDIT